MERIEGVYGRCVSLPPSRPQPLHSFYGNDTHTCTRARRKTVFLLNTPPDPFLPISENIFPPACANFGLNPSVTSLDIWFAIQDDNTVNS
jgi:hypothetical protein